MIHRLMSTVYSDEEDAMRGKRSLAGKEEGRMRQIVLPVGIALLLVLGGCSSEDPTTSDEYAALEQELARANQDLAHAESLLAEAAAERDSAVALRETIAEVETNETAKVDAFLTKDLDAMMDSFTDDVVFIDKTFGDHVVGRDEYREMNAQVIKWVDPDATKVVDRFVSEDGTRAVAIWEWIGTNYYGKEFDLPLVLIHEYRDGKVARQSIYYASPDAYSQLMGQ